MSADQNPKRGAHWVTPFETAVDAPIGKCGWCGGYGDGTGMQMLEGFAVPLSHTVCTAAIQTARVSFCCCYEFKGDNSDCPVHGGK